MINRFALSFLCIELDRIKICRVTGLYILLIEGLDENRPHQIQIQILLFKVNVTNDKR